MLPAAPSGLSARLAGVKNIPVNLRHISNYMSVNKFRNFKMVGYVVYGRGSFNQLDEILTPQRKGDAPMIFLLDHYFQDQPLAGRIPLRGKDKVILVDVS